MDKKVCKEENRIGEPSINDRARIMDGQPSQQESGTDIELDSIMRTQRDGTINNEETRQDIDDRVDVCNTSNDDENLVDSTFLHRSLENHDLRGCWPLLERFGPNEIENQEEQETSSAERLERYNNYLERYGPHLERYGEQLERFESQLERIGPHLERCGSNLERIGPQLEAIGRQLERSSAQMGVHSLDLVRPWRAQNLFSLQTQTESGNEGFGPQSSDSCQGSSSLTPPDRQPSWLNSTNSRRVSRRPSLQVNDGLLRHWIRRRNMEGRDIVPFSRFRDDRERRRSSIWRNDGDLREFRRSRGVGSRSHHGNFNMFSGQPPPAPNEAESRETLSQPDELNQNRSLRLQTNENNGNGGLLQQDRVRIVRRSPNNVHQDDPDYGFVLLNNNTPGPSRTDTSVTASERRPRSRMSLRPLNVFFPPPLGSIAEFGTESDEDNNDQRPENRRRGVRRRQGSTVRSWIMMNNYFQPRPIFIGQGDSKAMDGPFSLQRVALDEQLIDGNERNNLEHGRITRPIPRIQRADRRLQRQQISFQAAST